jgi:hypothetical protein
MDTSGGEEEDPEAAMMRLMGFSGFDSTKGKEVADPNANASAVFKKSVRSARQCACLRSGRCCLRIATSAHASLVLLQT